MVHSYRVFIHGRGTRRRLRFALAERVNAGLVRIEPLKGFNIAIGGMKAFLSMKSSIKPCKTDLAGIDELIIATPVWSRQGAAAMSTMYLFRGERRRGKAVPTLIASRWGARGSEGAIAT